MLRDVIEATRDGRPLTLKGPGTQRRALVDRDDPAHSIGWVPQVADASTAPRAA